MSNNYWDDEDDDDTTTNGSEAESDLQKKLRKKIRSDEKRIKELEEKLNGYTKVDREQAVQEILEKQGVNPKAARIILKDLEGDISEEEVLNWLDTDGDLFGFSRSEETSNVSDSDLQALRRQDRLTEGAITPDRGRDIELRIDQAQSAEELERILYSQ